MEKKANEHEQREALRRMKENMDRIHVLWEECFELSKKHGIIFESRMSNLHGCFVPSNVSMDAGGNFVNSSYLEDNYLEIGWQSSWC